MSVVPEISVFGRRNAKPTKKLAAPIRKTITDASSTNPPKIEIPIGLGTLSPSFTTGKEEPVGMLPTPAPGHRGTAAAKAAGPWAYKPPIPGRTGPSGTKHAHRSVPLLHDPTPPRAGHGPDGIKPFSWALRRMGRSPRRIGPAGKALYRLAG